VLLIGAVGGVDLASEEDGVWRGGCVEHRSINMGLKEIVKLASCWKEG
jgi:hypothetical protein